MIPAPLDDAAMAGERALITPAWLGKRAADRCRPMTGHYLTMDAMHDTSLGWWRRPWARYGLGWLALGVAALAAWRFYGWV